MQTVRDNASRIKRVRELRSTVGTCWRRLWVGVDVAQPGHLVSWYDTRAEYSGRSPQTSPYSHSPSTNTVPYTWLRNDLDT
jgi:hypothetical protein